MVQTFLIKKYNYFKKKCKVIVKPSDIYNTNMNKTVSI